MNFDDIELRLRYPEVFRQTGPREECHRAKGMNSNEVSVGASRLLHLFGKRKWRFGWLRALRRASGFPVR